MQNVKERCNKNREKRECIHPRQSSVSCKTSSLSLSLMIEEDVVVTASDVTTIRDCNLLMEALVLSCFASSCPLYSWLCNNDNFFSCSIFTPSLAYNHQHQHIINVADIYQYLSAFKLRIRLFYKGEASNKETVLVGKENRSDELDENVHR